MQFFNWIGDGLLRICTPLLILHDFAILACASAQKNQKYKYYLLPIED